MSDISTAKSLITEALAVLDGLDDRSTEASPATGIDPAEINRIEKVGKIAHLHQQFLDENGDQMTVADSRHIRRQLSPTKAKMRSTANLFGRSNSGAILYRDVPYGTRVKPGQPVKLTKEGMRLATAYRQLHGLDS